MDSESFIPNSVAKAYYNYFFPFDNFWRLFCNGRPDDICMTNREFSFRKQGYVNRYLSYDNVSQLRRDLLLHTPFRFELGAVYNARTADHIKLEKTFFDLEKELVFDIDLSDYNDVRTCCEGAQICEKCWPLMHIAYNIINEVLMADFGYANIMWVFSGRRGLHCWVFDERARLLDRKQREAILGYFRVMKGSKIVNLPRNHTYCIRRALDTIEPFFNNHFLHVMDPFDTQKGTEKFLSFLPEEHQGEIRHRFNQCDQNLSTSSSEYKWTTMLNYFSGHNVNRNVQFELEQYKLFCCYPRLDENVSSDRKHLLKTVFSVHPSTGLICVPIKMDAFAQFKPWRCRISAPPQQEEPIMSKEGPKLSAVERLKLAGRKKEEAAAADQPPEAPKEGKKMLLDTEEDEDEGEMQKEEEKPVDNSTTNVEQSEVIDLEKEETVNVFDERSALEWFEYAPNVEDLAAGKNTSATECMQKYLEYFGTIVTIFDANARNGLMEQQSE